MDLLKQHSNEIGGYQIAWFCKAQNAYVYAGNDPIDKSATISSDDLKPKLYLRARKPVFLNIRQTSDAQKAVGPPKKQARRTKERRIGNIIKCVRDWRTLYKGYIDSDGETQKKTLEEAALDIQISKKSLDDYLLQIRSGKRYGFNFDNHKEDKVGILRAYVKKHKKFEAQMKGMVGKKMFTEEIGRMRTQKGTPNCKDIKCCYPSYLEEYE